MLVFYLKRSRKFKRQLKWVWVATQKLLSKERFYKYKYAKMGTTSEKATLYIE